MGTRKIRLAEALVVRMVRLKASVDAVHLPRRLLKLFLRAVLTLPRTFVLRTSRFLLTWLAASLDVAVQRLQKSAAYPDRRSLLLRRHMTKLANACSLLSELPRRTRKLFSCFTINLKVRRKDALVGRRSSKKLLEVAFLFVCCFSRLVASSGASHAFLLARPDYHFNRPRLGAVVSPFLQKYFCIMILIPVVLPSLLTLPSLVLPCHPLPLLYSVAPSLPSANFHSSICVFDSCQVFETHLRSVPIVCSFSSQLSLISFHYCRRFHPRSFLQSVAERRILEIVIFMSLTISSLTCICNICAE